MRQARARDFDRWVRLTLRPAGSDLLVGYADEHGPRSDPDSRVVMTDGPWFGPDDSDTAAAMRRLSRRFPRLLVPARLASWLREGFADRTEGREHLLPEGSGKYAEMVPWLLPVFVRGPSVPPAPFAPFGLPWEAWLEQLLFAAADLSERCVLIRERAVRPGQPLALPLTVGDIVTYHGGLLEDVRARGWLAGNLEVQRYGLHLLARTETAYQGADVVVRMLGKRLPFRLRSAGRRRPKLIVSIVDEDFWWFGTPEMRLERDAAHLLVMHRGNLWPGAWARDLVTQLVYALVHDFALHEIAWIVRHVVPHLNILLVSDAGANQSLRLSAVLRNMADDARAHRPDLRPALYRLVSDFSRESRGLSEMSWFLANAERTAAPSPFDAAQPFTDQLPAPRRVDMSIDHYDAFGVLRPMVEYGSRRLMQCGWRYRLRVHIGSPERETSAMVGAVPAFDDLLPPPRDDRPRPIEVAVFRKAFELLSPPVQIIQLPRVGGTVPVYFELRAPQDPGPADLRVVLYSQGNLVQSFVLEADLVVDSAFVRDDKRDKGRSPRVRLASGGMGELETLEQLQPRALSVALNHDYRPGSHTVMLKGGDWLQQLHLNSAQIDKTMQRYRTILKAASDDPALPFGTTLRELASLGSSIWNKLALGNAKTPAVLAELRGSQGKTVQFVRHGSHPFPWQTIYDYQLPQGDGFLNADVCYGKSASHGPLKPGTKGCPHRPGEDVVCIEGFWSARHRIELLSEDGYAGMPDKTRAARATAPQPNPLVLLGLGADSLVADEFVDELKALLPSELAKIVASDGSVAELLWNEERRPALLILLAHLLEGDENANLAPRMHAFFPQNEDAVISVPVLSNQQLSGRWTDPRQPLVLLLACQSGRHDVDELTSLVDAFLVSGAAGVAGTEWDVHAETAANFARHIIEHTLAAPSKVALGEAMRLFVHESLCNGSIWPFVFTVYGSADLTVGRPWP